MQDQKGYARSFGAQERSRKMTVGDGVKFLLALAAADNRRGQGPKAVLVCRLKSRIWFRFGTDWVNVAGHQDDASTGRGCIALQSVSCRDWSVDYEYVCSGPRPADALSSRVRCCRRRSISLPSSTRCVPSRTESRYCKFDKAAREVRLMAAHAGCPLLVLIA